MSFTRFIMTYGCLIFFIIALIGVIVGLIFCSISNDSDDIKLELKDLRCISLIITIVTGILGFVFMIISMIFNVNHSTNQTSYTFDIGKHNDHIYVILNDSNEKYYISKSSIEVLDLNTEQVNYRKINYTDTDYRYQDFELKISPETAEELGIIDKVIAITMEK